ncbi:MAG TPA: tRNA guanosine(15) transglycosylase TgtA [Methanobacteriaceae archaeon]|nr:tRNA guanosine(15) transglycosylase TgtA [Methanobacteriaceae archaeon]
MNFEIKYKDAMGRIGILKTSHGNIRTPALMPVVHPGKQTLPVKDHGAEIAITNAYLIYKNDELREKALKKGVHNLIDFSGPIVTDSGSFQLSEYGEIEVSNQEIIEFQEAIGTDIGTSLDIPTPPGVKKERAQKELEITLERAREALQVRTDLVMNSVVQGSTFPDLRSYCAQELSKMDFEVHPIGAVVPLMESYRYRELVEVVMASVEYLPDSRPRHLMGAGHPMVFALAVAMGCDLFDSAAYILYAQDDRLLMPDGTHKLENILEMPCSCEVCTTYTPDELRKMDKEERTLLLAEHNLNISFAEIRQIRQAIFEGSLWELVENRCRAHPNLLDALRKLGTYHELLEKYDPPYKKSAFFYSGPESLNRPEVYRHQERLKKLSKKETLLLLPKSTKPYSHNLNECQGKLLSTIDLQVTEGKLTIDEQKLDTSNLQVAVVDVPFGVIPLELDQVYPLAQNEAPTTLDEDARKEVKKIIKNYLEDFSHIIVSEKVALDFNLKFDDIQNKTSSTKNLHQFILSEPLKIVTDDLNRIKMIADYQFQSGAGEALFNGKIKVVKSRKTGKIRHLYQDEELIATLRASDGVFVLAREGARRLHQHLPYPTNRVVVNQEAEPFACEGKSIFAKFVINCDIDIHAHEEVLIVNQDDKLLAFGKSILNGREITNFQTGQAVKTRKGGF